MLLGKVIRRNLCLTGIEFDILNYAPSFYSKLLHYHRKKSAVRAMGVFSTHLKSFLKTSSCWNEIRRLDLEYSLFKSLTKEIVKIWI